MSLLSIDDRKRRAMFKGGFFFLYCSEVDVRNKVVKLKIVASFEFLPKWQHPHPPVPFDITPFSWTPTMTTRPYKRD